MMNKLAIVIPAYKIDFFRATLDSLANQTCKDFTVYIGDDCSPADFKSLIDEYTDKIDIVYKRFENNLGGRDLVAQWTRCIDMTQGEPWLWLFSDDDVMGEHCVELFYNELSINREYDIFHFDIKIIDYFGEVVCVPSQYPSLIDVETLYRESSKANIFSFVVENVFSRRIYEKVNGFETFPLAWGSDMATWLKMGKEKGLKTIVGDTIYWRRSDKNITPSKEKDVIYKKFHIQIDYYVWINKFFNTAYICRFNKYVFLRYFVHYSNILSKLELYELCDYGIKQGVIDIVQKRLMFLLLPLIKQIQKVKSKILKK